MRNRQLREGTRREKSSTWVEFCVREAPIGGPQEKQAELGAWWTAGGRGRRQELEFVGLSQGSSYSPARKYTVRTVRLFCVSTFKNRASYI
jgi:hypothetical protein